jgi:hypothetical protein
MRSTAQTLLYSSTYSTGVNIYYDIHYICLTMWCWSIFYTVYPFTFYYKLVYLYLYIILSESINIYRFHSLLYKVFSINSDCCCVPRFFIEKTTSHICSRTLPICLFDWVTGCNPCKCIWLDCQAVFHTQGTWNYANGIAPPLMAGCSNPHSWCLPILLRP